MFVRISFTLIQVILVTFVFAQPTITNFSPGLGKAGTSITINGTNFSATPSNNTVYIGNRKANVTSASTTSLSVAIPLGALYSFIQVNVSNLQVYSDKDFNITFGDNESISSSSFSSGSSVSVDNNPSNIEVADIDLDGKMDVVAGIAATTGELSFFRNTSSIGSVSFASKLDVATANLCSDFTLADIDGDGLIDAIAGNTNTSTNNLQIFRNTSSSGTISFSSATNFSRPNHPYYMAVGDLNLDGKPDVVHGNFLSGNISIAENTSTSGSISLASHFNLATGTNPGVVVIEDIDGDGKRDIICTNYSSNSITYFRNIHSSGSLSSGSFSSIASISTGTGTNPQHITLADIDGDGKKDLVCTYQTSGNLVIHRNTSTSGSISFASAVSYTSGTTARSALVADVNGDGTPDVITSNIGSNTFRVYENSSTSGTISLSSGTTFSTNSQPYYAFPADLDGDTKPDMITANYGANNIQVFRNTQLATEPTTSSSFMSFGSLTGSSMTVSWANGNGARRIVALKASATPPSVTSPVDMIEYTANASFGSGSDLGSGWYVVYDGTGSSVNITDLTVSQQYYCVIFEYNGKDATINYHTSYASGTQLLPVEFLSFTATGSEKGVQLNWSTAWEMNNSHFEIERSSLGIDEFTYIGEHKGRGNSLAVSDYSYLDGQLSGGYNDQVYYRLKQVDFNGAFEYSKVVSVNPVNTMAQTPYLQKTIVDKEVAIVFKGNSADILSVIALNANAQTISKTKDINVLDCAAWSSGIYCIIIEYRTSSGEIHYSTEKVVKR